ncbi:MAG: hypothetical protein D6815_01510 [Candidatus Dadabacteria bacterium]|nr:MAG: hypothetical protein D6815_01510 [Candidatus Dadabacteria bacterium]
MTASGQTSSEERRELLAAVLDTLIPASEDGRMPGCGELGAAESVAAWIEASPAGDGALASILDAIDASARAAGRPFLEGTQSERAAAVAAVAAEQPDLFGLLWQATLIAYYQHPSICRKLGLRPGPPYPKGYEVPDTDFSLLEPVRTKQRLYRDA